MNLIALLAVGAGGLAGSVLRWLIGLRMNAILPSLPLGTLAANIIGGYIIGLAAGAVTADLGLSQNMRLFLIPGFCGGLTTFSTFSLETVTSFMNGRIAWGFAEIFIHVSGSLLATVLGLFTVRLLVPVLQKTI
ncbi:MAG: fluoride efflux transporter CrcB [Pseudomonadota bacterium]